MNFSEKLLGKDLSLLTAEYLEEYFNTENEETDILEFKSHSGNFKELLKKVLEAICALLNSGGGLIIWGAPAGTKVPHKSHQVFTGRITPIPQMIERDRFISLVSHSITPIPHGVRILPIAINNSSCICVIEVQESNYKPHQYDGRYFMRLDGQTVKAPHHYVEALIKQVRYPMLESHIRCLEINKEYEMISKGLTTGEFEYFIKIGVLILNMSGHINEEDIFYTISCPKGVFQRGYIANVSDPHKFRIKEIQPLLSFGATLSTVVTLKVNQRDLEKGMFKLYIHFGGKKSPIKRSIYTIDLNNRNDLSTIVVEKDENKLNIDAHLDSGKSLGEFVKQRLDDLFER